MRPFNFLALLLFTAGLVWVFTLSEDAVRQVQKTYYSSIGPMISKGAKAEKFAHDFIQEVEHSSDLKKQLEQSQRERDRFKLIASRVRELEGENNELRSALSFQKQTEFDVIASRVIRRQPHIWNSTIEINRGAGEGMGVSLCVLASNGGLVGRVSLPGDNTSSVLLITDEESQVPARVEGTPEVGLIVGQRTAHGESPKLRLTYLSKNAILKKGMNVYTDGRGKLFPANIPIGTIDKFEAGPVYGDAEITPAVAFNNLKTVFVITDVTGD